MSFAEKYNKGQNQFTYRLQSEEFKKLADLEIGTQYLIRGLFISRKGKFGDHPVAVGNDFFIDLPKNSLDTVKEILQDDDAVQDINDCKVAIVPETYTSTKYNKEFVGFNFVDVDNK